MPCVKRQENQRAALVRALIVSPKVLLLDEPLFDLEIGEGSETYLSFKSTAIHTF